MSVDWLFLIPVPSILLASDEYLDVDDFWKGTDYVIDSGDRWDPRVEKSGARRRAMALDLTRKHFAALRRLKPPREIVVTTDAAVPDDRARTYAEVRARWLRSGAFALPDVVDELVTAEGVARAVRPLDPSDVRIPFPTGTQRARLRRLDPTFALEQLRGHGKVPPDAVGGVRAGVVLVDVAGSDLAAIARHYRAALAALGMRPREDKPSKWLDEAFVQMRGRADGVEVLITAKPTPQGGLAIGVLWIEHPGPPSTAGMTARSVPRRRGTR